MQLDARLSKFVTMRRARIELFLEGFNVSNRTNLGKPVGNLRSVQFGESTTLAGPPRQLEIGFRVDF